MPVFCDPLSIPPLWILLLFSSYCTFLLLYLIVFIRDLTAFVGSVG